MSQLGQQGSRGTPAEFANKKRPRRHSGASQKMLEYLQQHANIALPYTQLQREFPEMNISNAVLYLKGKGFDIEMPMRGVAIFRTGPKPKPEPLEKRPIKILGIYEDIGTSNGVRIVRGEDGELYRLSPLFNE